MRKNFLQNNYYNTEEGQSNALTYLEERGYDVNMIEKFQLGYNPSTKNAFATAALQQQFNKEILLKSGLVVNEMMSWLIIIAAE